MESIAKPLIRASIAVIMLFQVAALFSRQYFMRELLGTGFDPTIAKHLSYLIVPVILLVLLWPTLRQNKNPLRRLFRRPQSWPKIIMAGVGLGFTLLLARYTGVFALTSFGLLDTAPPGQAIDFSYYFACPTTTVLLLALFATSIATPLTEEIINRGLILGALSNRDPRIAVVTSAVMFAILHEPSAMPSAFVFGLFVGVQLLRSGSLWAPIIAHSTANLIITLKVQCLQASWLPEESAATPIIFGSAMMMLAVVSIAVAIWIVAAIIIRPGADHLLQTDS